MLFHLILFPLFLLALISFGKGGNFLLSKIIQLEKGATDDLSILGITALFFLGFIGVIFNFFLPLASPLFLGIIGCWTVLGGIILIKERSRFPITDFLKFVAISIIIAPIAGVMSPVYDAGLYHLPHQLWLRIEPIVWGLANFHGRFGFGSLIEYISAPLWINRHFILLSYLQASFVVYFLLFLIEQVRISSGTHLILLLGISVIMATSNEVVLKSYASNDLPSALTFAAAFIYGHWLLFRDQASQRSEWAIFSILSLEAVFLKLSAIIIIFWFIFVILYRTIYKKDLGIECIYGLAIPIIFSLIFLFKNFINTGCLLYPEAASCLDVPWTASKNAISDANWITAWARHPRAGLYSLSDNSWFINWWLPHYKGFLKKLLHEGILVGVLYVGLALRAGFKNIKILDIRLYVGVAFVLLSLLFCFWKAPTPRFGIGVFILLFPVLFLFFQGGLQEKKDFLHKNLQVVTVIFVFIAAFHIGKPNWFLSKKNVIKFNLMSVPTPEVKKDSVWGVRPTNGDQCWLVLECAPYDRPPKLTFYGRSAFFENEQKTDK